MTLTANANAAPLLSFSLPLPTSPSTNRLCSKACAGGLPSDAHFFLAKVVEVEVNEFLSFSFSFSPSA